LSVDGAAFQSTALRCDYTRPTPCPNRISSYTLNTARLPDGAHSVTLFAANAAGTVARASRTIYVDNNAPDAPQAVSVDGGEAWRPVNSFTVHWRNPGGQVSPITTAHYRLCRADQPFSCQIGAQSQAGAQSLASVPVPATGDYTLQVWLEDQAGNSNAQDISNAVHLRFDDQPPRLAFLPEDPNNPRQVSVAVSEPDSGLAAGQIQISRQGTNAWYDVPTTPAPARLLGQIDDTHLPAGRYRLRAFARDAANNTGLTDLAFNGQPARVDAPLRIRMQMRAGFLLRSTTHKRHPNHRSNTSLRGTSRVRYGAHAVIQGRLTNTPTDSR
jgi:hypothetical protein